jgi:hypothetical protein
MTALAQLRATIDQQVRQQHARVVIAALQRLETDGLPHACTYHLLFKRYRFLHVKMTWLKRLDRLYENDLGYNDDLPDLNDQLTYYRQQISLLKLKRYDYVCGQCPECRTRNKPWPLPEWA